jgi:hypothetical protein
MSDVRRRAALVVDHRDLVTIAREFEHRADEVLARRPIEPGRADDPGVLARRTFTVQLRAPVGRERIRCVRLDVRLVLAAVENVVRRVVDEGRPELRDVPRAADVYRRRPLRVVLRPVHVRPRSCVQDETGRVERWRRKRNVPVGVRQADGVRKLRRERAAQLAAGAGDQDPPASRSDRIGDLVLQRSTTRGSFHAS